MRALARSFREQKLPRSSDSVMRPLVISVFAFLLAAPLQAEDLDLCYQGAAAQQDGDHEQAVQLYEVCLRDGDLSAPNKARVLYNRGTALQFLGRYEAALEDYGAAIDIEPGKASAYNGRCWVRALLRQAEAALEDCRESLRLNDADPYAHDSQALAHWLLGEEDAAREDLDRARALDPAWPAWPERFRQFAEMF